ncbi:MAG: flagellar biosynthesis anti-sigma factor FlgM [Caloramator sp.]|nr:flagellar biosynthesis anti-sigma factor FlgM [Caloramator sp.]
MKVNNNISRVLNIYSKNFNEKNEKVNNTNKKDTIEISAKGRELQRYIEFAKNIELKNNRAEEIKKLYDNGYYSSNADKIASSIIEYMKESDV